MEVKWKIGPSRWFLTFLLWLYYSGVNTGLLLLFLSATIACGSECAFRISFITAVLLLLFLTFLPALLSRLYKKSTVLNNLEPALLARSWAISWLTLPIVGTILVIIFLRITSRV